MPLLVPNLLGSQNYRKYLSCLSMVSLYLLFPIQIINASYVTVILNMEMILIEVANVFLTAADTQFI